MSEIINEVLKESLAEDAADLAAFDERVKEPLISYEQMLADKCIQTDFTRRAFGTLGKMADASRK